MIDIFNKKKIKRIETTNNALHGQIELLKTELKSKEREIDNLEQENKREIKTINDLIAENAKLIEWIQGILKASKICEVRDQVSTFTIPISKVEGNYGMEGSVEPFHQEDIFIPSIHFTTVNGNIWR